MPSLVPVRVAKDSSPPGWGDPLSGPECTNLKTQRQKKSSAAQPKTGPTFSPESVMENSRHSDQLNE